MLVSCYPSLARILDGSHPPEASQPEVSSTEETQGTSCTVPSWCAWKTKPAVPGRCLRGMAHLGHCARQALGCLRGLDPGNKQNAGPTWNSTLAEQPGARVVWIQKVHVTLGCGKPRVVHPLRALPTHASDILFAASLPLSR